jgi:hypothetical protein
MLIKTVLVHKFTQKNCVLTWFSKVKKLLILFYSAGCACYTAHIELKSSVFTVKIWLETSTCKFALICKYNSLEWIRIPQCINNCNQHVLGKIYTHFPEHQWYQHRCCQSTLSQQIGGPCSRIAALTKLRAAYERSVTRMRRWRRSRRLKLTRRPFHANAVSRRQ